MCNEKCTLEVLIGFSFKVPLFLCNEKSANLDLVSNKTLLCIDILSQLDVFVIYHKVCVTNETIVPFFFFLFFFLFFRFLF